jgi:hypothetical protein
LKHAADPTRPELGTGGLEQRTVIVRILRSRGRAIRSVGSWSGSARSAQVATAYRASVTRGRLAAQVLGWDVDGWFVPRLGGVRTYVNTWERVMTTLLAQPPHWLQEAVARHGHDRAEPCSKAVDYVRLVAGRKPRGGRQGLGSGSGWSAQSASRSSASSASSATAAVGPLMKGHVED